MNGEIKNSTRVIGITGCPEHSGWILTSAEKTPAGLRLGNSVKVSDAAKIKSEIEKMAPSVSNDEQNPVLVAVAVDTSQAGFFPFTIPMVESVKLEPLIASQAEMLLPMPLTQAVFTWRMINAQAGSPNGFLSAIRKSYFQELSGLTGGKTGSLIPDATSLVAAWAALFESNSTRAILIQIRKHNCILVLSEQEKMVCAAAVDYDHDLQKTPLTHDILGVLNTLDNTKNATLYITGQTETADFLKRELAAAGRRVESWKISGTKAASLRVENRISEISACPEAVGTTLAAFQETPEFDYIRRPNEQQTVSVTWDKRLWIRGLSIAAAMLLVLLGGWYWASQKELGHIQNAIAAEYNGTSGQKILSRQQMREQVAKTRPDIAELIKAMSECTSNDVYLDTFSFKKGQLVRITAKAPSFDRVYQFQDKLQKVAGVAGIKLISPTLDERKQQVQFTLTFTYKNFSGK